MMISKRDQVPNKPIALAEAVRKLYNPLAFPCCLSSI